MAVVSANQEALSRYQLVAKGNVARDHGWLVTSDFECGNGENISIQEDSASFSPEPDPGEGFSGAAYYFCAQVTNEREIARPITLTINAHYEPIWKGWSLALGSPLLVIGGEQDGADSGAWRQVPAQEMEGTPEHFRLTLEVPAGKSV